MTEALLAGGFESAEPQGAYYTIAWRDDFAGLSDDQAADKLIELYKVGAVPCGDFVSKAYKDRYAPQGFFRFCFSTPDEDLIRCAELMS